VSGRDELATIHAVFTARRPIDLDTNFFEAGFTSTQLAELLTELVGAGLDATLLDLFRYPTVRQLAAELGQIAPAPSARPALPWQR
jgi:aryl carrier-like protein